MERRALVALLTSLKMTKAWPLIFRLRDTRISRIWPNWEKMAYRDFFSSADGEREDQWCPVALAPYWELKPFSEEVNPR